MLGVAPESVAAVLTPGCESLIVIDRAGNIHYGFNPVTPLTNEIGKGLAAHLKQAGGEPGPGGTAAVSAGHGQARTAAEKEIRVRVDGTPGDARGLIERLNEHGDKDGVVYVQTQENDRFRIATATERHPLGGVGGNAVLTPECNLLFAVGRMGRFTRGGAINAVAKELHRNLSAHLAPR